MPNLLALLALIPLFGTSKNIGPLPISKPQPQVLASHAFSLNNRYDNRFVSDVFKDNILLNIAYMDGSAKSTSQVNWQNVEQPFEYHFKLSPKETFAFHDQVLPKYAGRVTKTTNAHFNSTEGFKSDGYLIGDGVCHLASLMYWTAKDAGLQAEAPTNHDFMKINEVPKEDGVAIFSRPGEFNTSANQNLYITNNQNFPVDFVFKYNGDQLQVTTFKESFTS